MIVRCPSCEARFHLADGRLPEKGARVRCSKCHHRFYVRPPGAGAEGAELEAESEPDAAPVPRQGKSAAPDPGKSAKGGVSARAEAKNEATARGEASAKVGQSAKAAAAKPAAAPAKPAKPAAAAPKPAAKPAPAKPAARASAPAAGMGGADDPDLEDPQFLFDKGEAEKPASARSGAKSSERPAAGDTLGAGALFGADDDDDRVEATLGEEEGAVPDTDARSDLFGDMAGLAAETEESDRAAATPPAAKLAPARPSAPAAPSRASAPPPAREESTISIGDDSEPMPSLDVKPTGRAGSSYQAGGTREQVERKAPKSAAARPAAEPQAAPAPPPDTPRARLLRALACAAGLALAVVGGRLVATHGMGPFAGPERLIGTGWEVRGVEVLRLRGPEGQLVLALRGTLDRSGSGALPALRATAADERGQPLGGETPVSWTWLDGAELTPDRLSHWIAAGPAPAPEAGSVASARFTVLIVDPPADARRILLRAG
jgi:predicted Zn finger-like uncharacterized protein